MTVSRLKTRNHAIEYMKTLNRCPKLLEQTTILGSTLKLTLCFPKFGRRKSCVLPEKLGKIIWILEVE